jgi:hypothetical protein
MLRAISLIGTIERSQLRETLANKALVPPVLTIGGGTLMFNANVTRRAAAPIQD